MLYRACKSGIETAKKMEFELTKNPRYKAIRAQVNGTITIENAQSFEKDLIRDTFFAEYQLIGLDLTGVKHMDSSGIGALIRINQAAKNEQKRIVVIGLSSPVEKIFNMTQLGKVLEVKPASEFSDEFVIS